MNSEPALRPVRPLKSRIPVPASSSLEPNKNKNVRKDELKGPEKKLVKNVLKQNKNYQIGPVSNIAINPPEVRTIPDKSPENTSKNIVQPSKTKITFRSEEAEKQTVVKKLTGTSKTRNNYLKPNLKLTAKNASVQKDRKPVLLSTDYQKQKVKNVSNSKSNSGVNTMQHGSGRMQNKFPESKLQSDKANAVESSLTSEKENKSSTKPSYLESQKDIKFEADEKYRRMILFGGGLSPNNFVRYSDRVSIYDVALEIPADPHEHARRTIKNLPRSDRKTSLISQSKSAVNLSPYRAARISIYDTALEIPFDPKKEALKAIENLSKSEMKAPASANLSPFKARSSLYTQSNLFHTPRTDPKELVKQSLAAMKQERLTKSNATKSVKKVTFNLNVEELTPRQKINFNPTPFKTEGRLPQINERSEENTPNTPSGKVSTENSSKQSQDEQKINSENLGMTPPLQSFLCDKTYPKTNKDNKFRTPQIKLSIRNGSQCTSITTLSENATEEIKNSVIQSLKKLDLKCLPLNLVPDTRITSDFLSKNNEEIFSQNSVQFTNKQNSNNIARKICTPKPISLYPKSSLVDNSEDLSPEFLTDHGNYKLISEHAPICTPLVLRSLAKSTVLTPVENLSPVRLKLDFTEDKDSPNTEDLSRALVPTFVDTIVTAQKQLDELADKECSFYLCDEVYPVLYNRFLQNPISRTLTEGDEMHFIPLT